MEIIKLTKEALAVFIIVIINCTLMAFIDGIYSADYVQKSIFKLIIFLILPLIYLKKHNNIKEITSLFKINKKNHSILKSLALGLGVFILIIVSYFTIGSYFDFNHVTTSLESGIGVNEGNFLFVALYISFVNSLLEEFFFRGYAFIYLSKYSNKKIAYIFSSLLFALYHVAMMITWFDFSLIFLLILCLFIGGLIFNFLDNESGTIYNSWFVHMFANFAINAIGLTLFGII